MTQTPSFLAAQRTCRYSPSQRRKHSRLACLQKHRSEHLFSAKVDYCTAERLLKIHVPVRPRLLGHRMRDRLVGQHETREERRARVLHPEILSDEGVDSFLIRLVRRQRSPGVQKVGKVAQFIFRIPGNWLEIDGNPGDRERGFLTPRQLVVLFRQAAECVVLLSGHDVLLTSLFHDGQIHSLGVDHLDEPAIEREDDIDTY